MRHQNKVQSLLVNGTLAYADILAAFPNVRVRPFARCRRMSSVLRLERQLA